MRLVDLWALVLQLAESGLESIKALQASKQQTQGGKFH